MLFRLIFEIKFLAMALTLNPLINLASLNGSTAAVFYSLSQVFIFALFDGSPLLIVFF